MTAEDMLAALSTELRKGRIVEAELKAEGWHLDGVCDFNTGHVYVDPAPSVTEALLHEMLHRRFPRWGEKRVDASAKRLIRSMTSRQVQWWYRQFKRRKKTSRKPVNVDAM